MPASNMFFCGEATNEECFMTAHGAMYSGMRAADEIMDHFGLAAGSGASKKVAPTSKL
jgi:hypothetical protein